MALSPKNLEARIQALEKQVEDDPTSAAFFPLANLIWKQGEADRAISLLTDGLENHPSYLAPRVLLGEIYLAKDQIENAAGELEKVVEKTPWNLTAQKLLMDCCRREGDEQGARRALVAVGMFDPTDEAARKVIDEGVPALSPETEIAEGDEAPLEESADAVPTPFLADLYVSQGHLDKALEVYRQLSKEEPDNEEYLEKISGLEQKIGEEGGEEAAVQEEAAIQEEAAAEISEEEPAGEVMGNDEIDIEAMLAEAGEESSAGEDIAVGDLADEEATEVEVELPDPVEEAEAGLEVGAAEVVSAEEPAGEEAAEPVIDESAEEVLVEEDDSASLAGRGDEPPAAGPAGENLNFVEDLAGDGDLETAGDLLGEQGLDFAGEAGPAATESESILRSIVEMYIQEGAYSQALDICRKAEGMGQYSAWLESQIRFLEGKAAEDNGEYLPETSEGDNRTLSPATVPSGGVVEVLEGWLRTIQRRKTELSAGPEGE